MKIALFALLGLVLGAIGGAALGIGAGLAWIEIAKPRVLKAIAPCWCFSASCRPEP